MVPTELGGAAAEVPLEEAVRRLPAWQEEQRQLARQQGGTLPQAGAAGAAGEAASVQQDRQLAPERLAQQAGCVSGDASSSDSVASVAAEAQQQQQPQPAAGRRAPARLAVAAAVPPPPGIAVAT